MVLYILALNPPTVRWPFKAYKPRALAADKNDSSRPASASEKQIFTKERASSDILQ